MKLFDTHCHFERADPTEIAAILLRARAVGVEKLMAVGGSPALNEAALVAAQVSIESIGSIGSIESVGSVESLESLKTLRTLRDAIPLDKPAVCVALGYDRDQVGRGEGEEGDNRQPTADSRATTDNRQPTTSGATNDNRQPTTRGATADNRQPTASGATADNRQPTTRGATAVCRLSFVEPLSFVGCRLSPPSPSPAAVGEIGLDYHYSPETREAQLELFAAQLEEARAHDLPVVIHTREADDDTVALLREIPSRGIIHCYTGSPEFARRYLDLGFYISISGIVTFRTADNVREAALVVPDDRILIETDSPFLAPVPMRGNANEPAFIRHTCEFLAKLRGTDPEAFAELTFANAERVLG